MIWLVYLIESSYWYVKYIDIQYTITMYSTTNNTWKFNILDKHMYNILIHCIRMQIKSYSTVAICVFLYDKHDNILFRSKLQEGKSIFIHIIIGALSLKYLWNFEGFETNWNSKNHATLFWKVSNKLLNWLILVNFPIHNTLQFVEKKPVNLLKIGSLCFFLFFLKKFWILYDSFQFFITCHTNKHTCICRFSTSTCKT